MASTSQAGPKRDSSPVRPSAVVSISASATAPSKQVVGEPVDAAHDWQTGFIWAFIAKFHPNMIGKNGLGTAMDLEQALHNDGQSDSLSYAFQKFLQCLNPTVTDRNINSQTVPRYLVRTIDNYLKLDRQSLYHPVYLSHHDPPRTPLPTQAEEDEWRKGLNPLRALFRLDRAEGEVSEGAKGGEDAVGSRIWHLDWQGKLKLLRQLVDWQLCLAPSVRETINLHYKVVSQRQTDFHKDTNPLIVEPLGIDRSKKRYWSFDDSPRIYTSSNPFKKSCPLLPISSTQAELESVIDQLRAEPSVEKPAQTGNAKTKAARKKAEEQAREKELWMATFLEQEHMPKIERERVRQEKARRKLETQAIMQAQAANRTTRTRTRQQAHRPSYVEFDRNDIDDFIDDRSSDDQSHASNGRFARSPPRTTNDSDADPDGDAGYSDTNSNTGSDSENQSFTPDQDQNKNLRRSGRSSRLLPDSLDPSRPESSASGSGSSTGRRSARSSYTQTHQNGHSNGNSNGKKRGFLLDDDEDEQLTIALAASKALADSQARADEGDGLEISKDDDRSNGRKKGRYIDPDGEDKGEETSLTQSGEGLTEIIQVQVDSNEGKQGVSSRMDGVIEIID